MNFITQESAAKLRGGYYTEGAIAAYLLRFALGNRPARMLEPSCGDGAFFTALHQLGTGSLEAVDACELDPVEAAKAGAALHALPVASTLVVGDFLEWVLPQADTPPTHDAVGGNPP